MASSNVLRKKSWSPYAVGVGLGILSWAAFITANHPLGITTAFEYTAALGEKAVTPTLAERNFYFYEEEPKIDWQWALVLGVFIGAFISSKLSGDRTKEKVPELWRQRFGSSVGKRFAAAFLGGAIMMFGARVADGCTSGHGISGVLQLAASSWLFVVVFFAAAIGAAFAIYGRVRGGEDNV